MSDSYKHQIEQAKKKLSEWPDWMRHSGVFHGRRRMPADVMERLKRPMPVDVNIYNGR